MQSFYKLTLKIHTTLSESLLVSFLSYRCSIAKCKKAILRNINKELYTKLSTLNYTRGLIKLKYCVKNVFHG